MQYVSSVDVTFNDITLTEIFEEGWVYDTLWVDEGCFVDGTGFPRCKIEGKNIGFPNGPSFMKISSSQGLKQPPKISPREEKLSSQGP